MLDTIASIILLPFIAMAVLIGIIGRAFISLLGVLEGVGEMEQRKNNDGKS